MRRADALGFMCAVVILSTTIQTSQFVSASDLTALEVQQLSDTLHGYRDYFGEFPPSLGTESASSEARLRRHLGQAFPRYRYGASQRDFDFSKLDPAEALVFFLGGVPKPNGEKGVCGFSIDARDPFRLPEDEHEKRIGPFYNFDPKRLVDQDNDGFYEYLPPVSKLPYVYFRADSYGDTYEPRETGGGLAVAYYDSDSAWQLPESFQIISAGLDGDLGLSRARHFPSMRGFTGGDFDNFTNFATRPLYEAVIEDSLRAGAGTKLRIVVILTVSALPIVLVLRRHMRRLAFVALILLYAAIVAAATRLAEADCDFMGLVPALGWVWTSSGGIAFAFIWWCSVVAWAYVRVHGRRNLDSIDESRGIFTVAIVLPFLVAWRPAFPIEAYLSNGSGYTFGLPFPFFVVLGRESFWSFLAIVADLAIGIVAGLGIWMLITRSDRHAELPT